MEAGKVETSDLVLVRTTTMFPKGGIVETTDKHSDLLTEDSPFARELKESGVIDLDKYNIVKFQNRRTIHFTLNGLVGSHEYGNFQNRNFIIIEPFPPHTPNTICPGHPPPGGLPPAASLHCRRRYAGAAGSHRK